jgi:hypothetical protein
MTVKKVLYRRPQVNTDVLVSLLLHVGDDNELKRDAAKQATLKVLATFDEDRLSSVAATLTNGSADYPEFLRQVPML